MNLHKTDIETEDLGNGIFRLNEYDFANCYLVIGEERAGLIDAGTGIAEISAVVRRLTDKPVTVLITHAHADHVGGAVWFPEAYIHPLDAKRGRQYQRTAWRMYFLYCHKFKRVSHGVRYRDALQREYTPKLLPMNEGDVFDLGGRTLQVLLTPGHSAGSVILRDSKTGAVFTGDNVNPMVTLQYPGGGTVTQWIESAKKTLAAAGSAPIYGGHGDGRIPHRCVDAAISLAEEILAADCGGRGRGTKIKKGPMKYPCIVYKGNRI